MMLMKEQFKCEIQAFVITKERGFMKNMKTKPIKIFLSLLLMSLNAQAQTSPDPLPEAHKTGSSFEVREKTRLQGLPFRRAVTPEESYRAYELLQIQADNTQRSLVENFKLDAQQQKQINGLKVTARLQGHKIGHLETRTGVLEYRVDSIDGQLFNHSYRLGKAEQRLDSHDRQLSGMSYQIYQQGQKVGHLQSTVTGISQGMSQLQTTVGQVQSGLRDTQDKLKAGEYGNVPENCLNATVVNPKGSSLYSKIAFSREVLVPGIYASNAKVKLLETQVYRTTFTDTPMLSVNVQYHDSAGVPQSVSGFMPKKDVGLNPDCKF